MNSRTIDIGGFRLTLSETSSQSSPRRVPGDHRSSHPEPVWSVHRLAARLDISAAVIAILTTRRRRRRDPSPDEGPLITLFPDETADLLARYNPADDPARADLIRQLVAAGRAPGLYLSEATAEPPVRPVPRRCPPASDQSYDTTNVVRSQSEAMEGTPNDDPGN